MQKLPENIINNKLIKGIVGSYQRVIENNQAILKMNASEFLIAYHIYRNYLTAKHCKKSQSLSLQPQIREIFVIFLLRKFFLTQL